MSKKTVGLATCFIDNYGACLQAYALQTKIEQAGCDCRIICYTAPHNYEKSSLRRLLIYNPFFLNAVGLVRKSFKTNHIKDPKFEKFRKKYLKFTQEYKTAESAAKSCSDFDAYVCGSDQVWNPVIFGGNDPIYTLDFVPQGKKRIAYAPSIALSEFPDEYKSDFKAKLDKFDYISVREKSGKDIADKLTEKEVKVVLDPTLLLNGDNWSKIALPVKIEKPYIFCYIFGTRPYIGEFIEYVRNKTGMNVVCIPYTEREKASNYTKIYDAGPCEFLWLIKNASLVITDSFHATAFSINFNTPFYSLLRNEDGEKNNMNSRIFSILDLVDLNDRLVKPDVHYPFDIKIDMNFSDANNRLNAKRSDDFGDLKNSLEQ